MHKSTDFGYYVPETHQAFYPSLMSPLRVFVDPSPCQSTHNGIFQRLQADTELRLRARVNSVSPQRYLRPKSSMPIEEILIRKGKDRELRRQQLMESGELRKLSQLQEKPVISANSQAIIKNKLANISRLSRCQSNQEISKPLQNDSNENKKTEENLKTEENPAPMTKRVIVCDETPKSQEQSKNSNQDYLMKQLEAHYKKMYYLKSSESAKNLRKEPEVRYSNRTYVPMFTKPLDLSKILSSEKAKKMYSQIPESQKKIIKIVKPEISNSRPVIRPVSECSVKITEAVTYQQIIRNRIINSIR